MKILLRVAVCCTVAVIALNARVIDGQSLPYSDFQKKAHALLLSYGAFKGYPEKTAAGIDGRLSEDRRAVFQSVIWAAFTPLTPRKTGAIPANARLIDYIEAVHGIWGVRPGDENGKHQFRLSLKYKPELKTMVEAAKEFKFGMFCHVLLAEHTGGDDQMDFMSFRFAPQTGCRRSASRKLQVGWDKSNPTVGEIDLDLDSGSCHTQPANSDTRSFKAGDSSDHHLTLFNRFNPYFDKGLVLKCDVGRFHCLGSYADDLCK